MNGLITKHLKPAVFIVAAVLVLLGFFAYTVQTGSAESSTRSLEAAAMDWTDAFDVMDYNRVSDYLAEDIVAMYPLDSTPSIGREFNREGWKAAFEIMTAHPITTDVVVMGNSKDVGYTFGRWAASGIPDIGTLAGRYVATWVRTDEGWRVTYLSAHTQDDVSASDILGK